MVTVLELRFPAGRYHATPWGHHVNEGQLEWPPAPWRLLRALLATGFAKLSWPAEGPPALARSLIERLAAVAPRYSLPRVSVGHSRHYVEASGKRPLIFDAWARIEAGESVEVIWDLDLPEGERRLLDELAKLMNYLGRAESWVDARLGERANGKPNCYPVENGDADDSGETVRVLCSVDPTEYLAWRDERVKALMPEPTTGKKPSAAQQKKLRKALEPFPPDLIAALSMDTGTIQSHGWSMAPGTKAVVYRRTSDALSPGVVMVRRTLRPPTVPFALLALSSASRATTALPPPWRIFPQGRIFHRALASHVGRSAPEHRKDLALSLLGRAAKGPAVSNHQHANFLHLDLAGKGRLDHVLVFSPMGLTASAQDILRRVRKTYMKGGAGELQVALAALGGAEELRGLPEPYGQAMARVLGATGGERRWRSMTPYVAPRHLKRNGKDRLEEQVRVECRRRGLPEPLVVRLLRPGSRGIGNLRNYVFHDGRHSPPGPHGYCLELEFEQPVFGPVCLGYGAHAGLGLFEGLPSNAGDGRLLQSRS